jgi:quercetin dioxygenase-like cupin family protein
MALVAFEQFTADEVRVAPGDDVLLPRDRPHDAEAFLVFEGELTFGFGDGEHRVEPGTWVFAPPGVTRTMAVTGAMHARFLHIRVPSSDGSGEVILRRAGGVEGENITNRPERRATVLVETEELTISEFDYGPGERGAKPHVHRNHADAFLVLDGEFTFRLRDGSHPSPAGTFLVFPPGVVHGFDNDSVAHARCFNFHMPSSGFAEYLRGRKPDFDQHDPPEDGGVDPAAVVVARLYQEV